MLEVGGEVGLFYYYYKTKDELFTDVLDHFFEPYRKPTLRRLSPRRRRSPIGRCCAFQLHQARGARLPREGTRAICTARCWAIREQTLTVIEPYIEDIIRTLMTCGAKPTMDPHTMAIFLAHGLGAASCTRMPTG